MTSSRRQPGRVPTVDRFDSALQFAVLTALKAGRMMRSNLGAAATTKVDGTPVTPIDRDINSMVGSAVAARGELMLGEEDDRHGDPTPGQVWVCDPIDGTWLYAAGVPGSVFSLALVDNGNAVLGVVYDPWTDRLIHAVTGSGAFVNGRPTVVNTAGAIAGACLVLPGGAVRPFDARRLFAQAVDLNADVLTTGSAVHDAVMVPLGFAAGTVYPFTSPWDMAAVAVIVAEAGGRITDLRGAPQRYDSPIKGAVISNGLIHDHLLSLVATASGGAITVGGERDL